MRLPLAILTAILCTASCSGQVASIPSPASIAASDPASITASMSQTMSVLAGLPIIVEGSMAGYRRELFGQPWRDTDHTGCDQRTDVIIRDASVVIVNPHWHCQITAVSLVDPYTGGHPLTSTTQIQIDHVVPLAAAWRAGASAWDTRQRELFATDMDNLIPTKSQVNQQKSDQTPDTWRPPDSKEYCGYATIYIVICNRYHLGITQSVHDALIELLKSCA